MHALNSFLLTAFDWLLAPLNMLPAFWSLLVVSIVAGVVLVYIYGKVSNQRAIRRVKDSIYGAILEAVLFRHNIRLCLGAQLRLLGSGALYFLLALPPVLVMAIPCVLLLAQLNIRYAARPIQQAERVVVKIVADDAQQLDQISLRPTPGLRISSPVRIPSDKEIYWRLDAVDSGTHDLQFVDGTGQVLFRKALAVGDDSGPKNGVLSQKWWVELLYPYRERLPQAFKEFSFEYPWRDYKVFGFQTNWLVIFFVASLAAGLVGSKVLRVEI